MNSKYLLISHSLCPYVQRAAIVLREKGIEFERRDIDLANKPDWFLALSPLGKTPVLVVDGKAIFESAVICEYLDETLAPRVHPEDALVRAQHRGWMEFGSALLNNIGTFYSANNAQDFANSLQNIKQKFEQIETNLESGPYFAGEKFSLVDAVFGPIFRYFDVFDTLFIHGVFDKTPKIRAWRSELSQRPSIKDAVSKDYPELLKEFIKRRSSELASLINIQTDIDVCFIKPETAEIS